MVDKDRLIRILYQVWPLSRTHIHICFVHRYSTTNNQEVTAFSIPLIGSILSGAVFFPSFYRIPETPSMYHTGNMFFITQFMNGKASVPKE